ncbi:putative bifunctional diguanylate cyclase/phosphodiesterase [Clostridium sp. ZS2-4]|uniref:putative bifunctional diguanylate cyclase/phosphodiesterase n=1 Tax=Clostridium sp. ZS2-4 TaxID=2987703 RepID=UPI00227B8849|nr:EAL domain-containing protein [Clostridium sp. ZS2-4]MCY6355691.1 EAL domain-containing protein [Clostridium sp. ZS2-4]
MTKVVQGMKDRKDIIWFDNKMMDIYNKFSDFLEFKKDLNPQLESLKIIIIYVIIGALWILLSDEVLDIFINDTHILKEVQLYKGWFYVVVTGAIFYFIINSKMMLFKLAIDKILEGYDELSFANEELMALDEELSQQYDELEKHRNELVISNQRYELAVEGANDGIWDWDLQTGVYFFTIKWKKELGYDKDELEHSLETWKTLLHPEDLQRVLDKIEAYLISKEGIYEDTYRIRCKDGQYRWILSRGKGVWDSQGNLIRIAGSHTDITEQVNLQDRLQSLAYYDTLTQLPNRTMLQEEVRKQIKQAQEKKHKLAFIYFDIDNFKHINDTMGHDAGDKLILHIANMLLHEIKSPNLVARLSGDEFAIVLVNVENTNNIILEINRIFKYIRRPWILEKQEFYISASMGVAVYPEHGTDLSTLMKNADTAMFHIKENGKDGFGIFTCDMREKTWRYIQMSNQLRYAIQNEEFVLYYQPQIDLNTGKIIGVEALIRWIHPEKGFISPMEFIPFAEETGYIREIGEWVLKTACKQKRKWEEEGYSNIKMSINLSSKRLTQEGLVSNVQHILEEYNMNACNIELEITETAVMDDLQKAIEVLQQLKQLGITIALDDFGTGYSSLTYVQKLPIDILKVDREFIKNIINEDEESYIFKLIVELAHSLDLKVIAEGVETKEQLAFLKKNVCDIGQGYYFSRPIPASEIEKMLV